VRFNSGDRPFKGRSKYARSKSPWKFSSGKNSSGSGLWITSDMDTSDSPPSGGNTSLCSGEDTSSSKSEKWSDPLSDISL
jgi:hypothetical protein